MICFPHAKINLGLHVLGKRKDGYHNLQTCFYPILGFTDVLEIVVADKFQFTTSGLPIDSDTENNLVVKAFRLMQQKFSFPNARIHLHKNIPIGAGLGGGSSDAAFVLRLCNELFKLNIPAIELKKLSSELGSDCAFFIGNDPALGFGRGEILEALYVEIPKLHLILISPGIHVSTKEAFEGLAFEPYETDLDQVLQTPVKKWKNHLYNTFESSVFTQYPEIAKAKAWLYEQGAEFALMSGSGSNVFGVFLTQSEIAAPPSDLHVVFCSEQIHLTS